MKKIDVKLGYSCNNHCRFCIQGGKRNFRNDQTTEEVKKVLADNKDFEEVVFTGGEVTIRADILELVKYAKQCGYKIIRIQSNGRMFSYFDFCQRIIDAGANEFMPSIHGSTAQMHDSLTCAKGSFEQTLKGICNLKKLNQGVYINSVVTRKNYHDLFNLAKLLVGIKVNSYQFAFMHINSVIQHNVNLVEEIVPRYNEVKLDVEKALQLGIDNKVRSRVEAFPFCTLDKKYHNNISENYMSDAFIYENNKMSDFKKMKQDGGKIKGEKCKQCEFYKKCEGSWCEYTQIFGFDEFEPIKKYEF
ncbi:MAG: radical SAM protein [Candidatus Pacebacteria bacterium]|nr:radical SAM protein [Candidatus Paceibacterota bacterium]